MRNQRGKEGESLCLDYLAGSGFRILATNYHSVWGEIDIIAQETDFLVFIEVKTRSSSLENALHAVSQTKIRRLVKTANCYLSKFPQFAECFTRFDVIAPIWDERTGTYRIHHLRDAFRPPSIED
jgi:putative endonuclease